MYKFTSAVRVVGDFKRSWSQQEIKNEPMLFNCHIDFAYTNAGPLTRAFLDALPPSWRELTDIIIDSRTHMLMPGWYPCIPGWHHDDVARMGPDNQPNYDRQPYLSKHVLGVVNAEICPTLFAVGEHKLAKPPPGVNTYKFWHEWVEKQVAAGVLETRSVQSGKMYQFDWQTMHRGQAALSAGWRWFIRLTKRQHNHTNEIRNQVQVYLEDVNAGW